MTRLRHTTAVLHLLLIAALGASAFATPSVARAVLALVLVAPLLYTLPGLVRGRVLVEQRLAVLLVVYIGGTSVEVVARAGAAQLLNTALLAAALELALLLALIRHRRSPPTAHE